MRHESIGSTRKVLPSGRAATNLTTNKNKMNTEKAKDRLYNLNLKSLDFARFEVSDEPIKYPISDKVENAKYEMYCILWFNFISELFESDQIESPSNILFVREVFTQHQRWWECDPGNRGYSERFREYVAGELSQ